MKLKTLCVSVCLALASGGASAAEFFVITDGSLGGAFGYDPQKPADENFKSGGGEASLYLGPRFKPGKSGWLLSGDYDFDYSGNQSVIKVDEEVFMYLQSMTNLFDLGASYRTRGGAQTRLTLFGELFNGTQAADESLSTALYNYRDIGAELGWEKTFGAELPFLVGVGVKLTDRFYPNYITLDVMEHKEKDATIAKLYLNGRKQWTEASATLLTFSIQNEAFKDAPVIDETGTTYNAAANRRDIITNLSLGVPVSKGPHRFNLDYSLEIRNSNENYLDTNTNLYIEGINSYLDNSLGLNYAYTFDVRGFLSRPEISLGGEFGYRYYPGKLAKDKDGNYGMVPANQADNSYKVNLGFLAWISEHWSWKTGVDYAVYLSNNKDESTSLYNYRFFTLRTAAQFSY